MSLRRAHRWTSQIIVETLPYCWQQAMVMISGLQCTQKNLKNNRPDSLTTQRMHAFSGFTELAYAHSSWQSLHIPVAGHLACVKLLLEEGADIEQRNVVSPTC